jgi:indoleamine 2,3-dioxygenase
MATHWWGLPLIIHSPLYGIMSLNAKTLLHYTIFFLLIFKLLIHVSVIIFRRFSARRPKRSMKYGFLADHNTLQLGSNFEEFTKVITGLTIQDGHIFRKLVDDMKITRLSKQHYIDIVNNVKSEGELRYVYSVFTFVCQKYIRCLGKDEQLDTLPYHIGLPWHISAKRLGLPEATTYSSVVLNNWRPKYEKFKSIDDIEVIHTITNTEDEKWFYKIHMAIELMGAPVLQQLSNWDNIVKSKELLAQLLADFCVFLRESTKLVNKMTDHCNPEFFWGCIRIYLAGYDDKTMFPDGLKIENTDIQIRWAGGSGAQSTLLQMTDTVFGVKHDIAHAGEFLNRMRTYMPPADRNFLLLLEKNGSIEKHVKKFKSPLLGDLYKLCLSELAKFRHAHMSIVHKYIWNFVERSKKLISSGDVEGAKKILGNNVNSDGGSGSLGKTIGANEQLKMIKEKDGKTLIDFLTGFADDTLFQAIRPFNS